MGIPHLTRHLQPYGEKIVYPKRESKTDAGPSTAAIIDGPALAYHCFYACLARNTRARNALEAMPSYQTLGDAAVTWLDQVESYGFKMCAPSPS